MRASPVIRRVLQVLHQQAMLEKDGEVESHSVLHGLDLSALGWGSNMGCVIEVLLKVRGLRWSDDGSKVWHIGEAANTLRWREKVVGPGKSSKRPAPQHAATVLGGLPANLAHDAEAEGIGARAAQRTAEAARPTAPRRLAHAKPAAADRLKRGSGWGNVPRALGTCCVCEVESLETLVVLSQEHALVHPEHPPLQAHARRRARHAAARDTPRARHAPHVRRVR